MKSLGLAFFTDTHWTLVGLIIFFSLFVILTAMQLKGYDKKKIETLGNLPMEGE